jgi:hypothetical protein
LIKAREAAGAKQRAKQPQLLCLTKGQRSKPFGCFALCFADRQSTGSQGLLRCKAKKKVFLTLARKSSKAAFMFIIKVFKREKAKTHQRAFVKSKAVSLTLII